MANVIKVRITSIPSEMIELFPVELLTRDEITLQQAENISLFVKEFMKAHPDDMTVIRNCGKILSAFPYSNREHHTWWMILTQDLDFLDFRLNYGISTDKTTFGISFHSTLDRVEVMSKLGPVEFREITRIMSSF